MGVPRMSVNWVKASPTVRTCDPARWPYLRAKSVSAFPGEYSICSFWKYQIKHSRLRELKYATRVEREIAETMLCQEGD
jgi:hypothetical protein